MNFSLVLTLCFSLIAVNFTAASSSSGSSPKKFSRGRTVVSTFSPKRISPPAPVWFTTSIGGPVASAWNVYGQWFDQVYSKPSGKLVHLKSVRNVDEFWSFISTKQMSDVDRVDISIFRPGVKPDFAKFTGSGSGYILSYKLKRTMIDGVSSATSSAESSPVKMSRNEAKKLKELEVASPLNRLFPHLHVFDPLISAAMECENPEELPSEIIGFLFKRQYEHTFLQVFVDGIRFEASTDAHDYIEEIITRVFPTVVLKTPRFYWLSVYSSKIVGLPSSQTKASPFSSPSRIVTITETSEPELLKSTDEFSDSENIFESSESISFEDFASSSEEVSPAKSAKTNSSLEDIEEENNPVRSARNVATLEDIIEEEVEEEVEEQEQEFMDDYEDGEAADYEDEESDEAVEFSSSSSSESSEEAVKNEITFSSKLSPNAPIFNPNVPFPHALQPSTPSIEQELLGRILNEDFNMFALKPEALHLYFEMILYGLEADRDTNSR